MDILFSRNFPPRINAKYGTLVKQSDINLKFFETLVATTRDVKFALKWNVQIQYPFCNNNRNKNVT